MFTKFTRLIRKPIITITYILERLAFLLPDVAYLKARYYLAMDKPLNLETPITFNEKIQWLKLNDRNPFYTKLVDKYEVKRFVELHIGRSYIIPTLGVYKSFDQIDFNELPSKFVLKCTHDSGGVVLCKNKDNFDVKRAGRKLIKHLSRNPFYTTREWPYKHISPRIIAEQYIEDTNDEDLKDYKFFLFHGEIRCLFVASNRQASDGVKVDYFDEHWNHLPFKRVYDNSIVKIPKPVRFEDMKCVARSLAKYIPSRFVRIDLYEVNGHIYFGEITLYPGGGWERFSPQEWDTTLGSWLSLN